MYTARLPCSYTMSKWMNWPMTCIMDNVPAWLVTQSVKAFHECIAYLISNLKALTVLDVFHEMHDRWRNYTVLNNVKHQATYLCWLSSSMTSDPGWDTNRWTGRWGGGERSWGRASPSGKVRGLRGFGFQLPELSTMSVPCLAHVVQSKTQQKSLGPILSGVNTARRNPTEWNKLPQTLWHLESADQRHDLNGRVQRTGC